MESPQQQREMGTVIILTVQMGKLRHRNTEYLAGVIQLRRGHSFLWWMGQTLWVGGRQGVWHGAREGTPTQPPIPPPQPVPYESFPWLNTSPAFCGAHCAKLHGECALQITLIIRSYMATFILIKLGLIPLALILNHWHNSSLMAGNELPQMDGVKCTFNFLAIPDYFVLRATYWHQLCCFRLLALFLFLHFYQDECNSQVLTYKPYSMPLQSTARIFFNALGNIFESVFSQRTTGFLNVFPKETQMTATQWH